MKEGFFWWKKTTKKKQKKTQQQQKQQQKVDLPLIKWTFCEGKGHMKKVWNAYRFWEKK